MTNNQSRENKEQRLKKLVESALQINNEKSNNLVEIENRQKEKGGFVIKISNNGLINIFDVLGEVAQKYDIRQVDVCKIEGVWSIQLKIFIT